MTIISYATKAMILSICSISFLCAESVEREMQQAQKKIDTEVAKATKKIADASSKDVVLGTSPVVSTFDQITTMSQSELGKEEQAKIEQMQAKASERLEGERKTLDDRLKLFNAKKETLSDEARKKEEQELMTASGNLQNEVRKAQELIRAEMTKATEQLAKLTEEAAVEIAKAEKVDVLLEKNTGRVLYTKNGSDLTDKIQKKMNEKTALARNKNAPKAPVKTASAEPKKSEKAA